MDSRSSTVRIMYKLLCSWGRRTVVEMEQPYKGGPTPLWKNIGVQNFQRLKLISMFLLLATGFEYIYMEVFQRSVEREKEQN